MKSCRVLCWTSMVMAPWEAGAQDGQCRPEALAQDSARTGPQIRSSASASQKRAGQNLGCCRHELEAQVEIAGPGGSGLAVP